MFFVNINYRLFFFFYGIFARYVVIYARTINNLLCCIKPSIIIIKNILFKICILSHCISKMMTSLSVFFKEKAF